MGQHCSNMNNLKVSMAGDSLRFAQIAFVLGIFTAKRCGNSELAGDSSVDATLSHVWSRLKYPFL